MFRLAHLRLEGFAPTDVVWFCAECDYQGALSAIECPKCGAHVEAARIPDVIDIIRARAA